MRIPCTADEVRRLSPEEMRAILDTDKQGDYFLLDVRQSEEYEAGYIPGAIPIPLGELEARQEELDRSKKIIAYCRSGHRSMAAAMTLCGLGFKDIHHLEGGIINWHYETIPGMPEERPELIARTTDVRDILMLAIKLEKGSWDFYMAAKDKVSLPKVRETLQMLADVEDGHMQRLYECAVNLVGEKALPPLEKLRLELRVEHMEGGIEISPALAKVEEFADEMEALEIALEREFMSYDFYKRSSMLMGNPNVKTLLYELALEERNHADTLLKRVSEIVQKR